MLYRTAIEIAAEYCAKLGKTMVVGSTQAHHSAGAGGRQPSCSNAWTRTTQTTGVRTFAR